MSSTRTSLSDFMMHGHESSDICLHREHDEMTVGNNDDEEYADNGMKEIYGGGEEQSAKNCE